MESNVESLPFGVYVEGCKRTAKLDEEGVYMKRLDHFAMGVAEEGGEILSLFEAYTYKGKWLDREELIDELGDFLWYSTMLAVHIDYNRRHAYNGFMTLTGLHILVKETYGSWIGDFIQFGEYGGKPTRGNAGNMALEHAIALSTSSSKMLSKLKKVVHFGHSLEDTKNSILEHHRNALRAMNTICAIMEISVDAVAKRNLEKLQKRYPEGFTQEASINRVE